MEKTVAFMDKQYDSRKLILLEHFNFWLQMQCKSGETVSELTPMIQQGAVKRNFDTIKDPQDEAM